MGRILYYGYYYMDINNHFWYCKNDIYTLFVDYKNVELLSVKLLVDTIVITPTNVVTIVVNHRPINHIYNLLY